MLFKNVASQKLHVYAYDSTTGAAKTGDAANITAYVSLDGTANAIDDTNPAEVDSTNMPGVYVFDLAQAETNCNSFALYAKSATANIRIEPIIGFTTGAAVTQTGDSYALANGATGFTAIDTVVDAIKVKTDNLPTDPADQSAVEAAITAATSGLATSAALAIVAGYIDTEITAILGYVDCLPATWVVPGTGTSTLTAGQVRTELATELARIDATISSRGTGTSTHSAADVVTAMGTGGTLTALATATNLAAAKAILDKFNTMVVLDGAVYDFTADSLAAGPGGSGSDPLSSAVPGSYAAGTAGYVLGTYLDAAISGVGGAVGSGADSVTITWTVDGNPVADADVWVSTDAAGTNVVAGTLQTNSNGKATFMLDAGSTYYLWGQRDLVNPLRGSLFVAVAD